jgi:hypothetical protein
LDRKKQAAWRTRNPARNVLSEGAAVEVVSTLKLIEAGAEFAISTSIDFRQEFSLHEGPMLSLSIPSLRAARTALLRGRADSNAEHGSSWEKSVCNLKSVHDKLSLR